jgi:erythromycin esterase-like protein
VRLREAGNPADAELVEQVALLAKPLASPFDLDPLIGQVAEKKVVLLGEASHGTHEFYEWRHEISRKLIENHGFRFIAVEGDWPPSWQLNNFVHGQGAGSVWQALSRFDRWPTWMWANAEVAKLASWMRQQNDGLSSQEKCGFYGLDVYSLFESVDAAVTGLGPVSPFLARRIKARYACFDPFRRDEKSYARSLLQFPEGCQDQVARNLSDLLQLRLSGPAGTSPFGDAFFDAEQNARIVANAESYYRTMVHGNEDSWNVRDRHMMDTLGSLLDRYGPEAKGIVWAHNTHIGDYRATDMAAQGQINIGGLAREKWGEENVALVGMGTYRGEVIASHSWDGPIERLEVPAGKPGSFESTFHKVCEALSEGIFLLDLTDPGAKDGALSETRGHRAIGVVYHPAYEGFGNYVPTTLPYRYDAFLFFDRTSALNPLGQGFNRADIPETWPQGM